MTEEKCWSHKAQDLMTGGLWTHRWKDLHPCIFSRIIRIHPLYFSGFLFFPVKPKKKKNFLTCSWPYNCTPYDTGYCTDCGAWDFCLKVSLFRCKIECWPTAELWETQYFVLYWLLIWGLCSAHTHCLGSLLCFTCSSQGFHTYLIFLMVWLALFSWHTN